MDTNRTIAEARTWFAEDIRAAAPVRNDASIVDAFARVPREHYLGAGPWRIQPRQLDRPAYDSPNADPRHIYHDVLVSIDADRDLNNGLPSLWAYYFDHLRIRPGATVLQVGAGVGYFTAILAELAGPTGRVIAYEIDASLAARAERNLQSYPIVEVIAGNATAAADLPALHAVAAFAGATRIPDLWLSKLASGGRMAIPFTGEDRWGFMLLIERSGDDFAATALGSCGFYHCGGARTPDEAAALHAALAAHDGKAPALGRLYRGQPQQNDPGVWYRGDGFWLSKAA